MSTKPSSVFEVNKPSGPLGLIVSYQRWSPRGRPWPRGRPRGHILNFLALKLKSLALASNPRSF